MFAIFLFKDHVRNCMNKVKSIQAIDPVVLKTIHDKKSAYILNHAYKFIIVEIYIAFTIAYIFIKDKIYELPFIQNLCMVRFT